jgi:hypothetical protein
MSISDVVADPPVPIFHPIVKVVAWVESSELFYSRTGNLDAEDILNYKSIGLLELHHVNKSYRLFPPKYL